MKHKIVNESLVNELLDESFRSHLMRSIDMRMQSASSETRKIKLK